MQTGGALLELVARGKKDALLAATSAGGVLGVVGKEEVGGGLLYAQAPPPPRLAPTLGELRHREPRNAPRWGGHVDFEVEGGVGDVLREPTLLIELPPLVAPEAASLARSTPVGAPPRVLHAESDTVVGYAPNVALRLVRLVQLFVDTNVVQEWWGAHGEAVRREEEGSEATAPVVAVAEGWHDGSPSALCKASAPPPLRLRLSLLDGGDLPLCAFSGRQTLRLRVHLSPLADCLAAVHAGSGAPTALPPDDGAPLTAFTPRYDTPFSDEVSTRRVGNPRRATLPPPTLTLRTRAVYMRSDARELLNAGTWRVPFATVLRTAAEVEPTPGGTSTLPLVDVVGAVGRLLIVVPPAAAKCGVTLQGAALLLGDKVRVPFLSSAVHGVLTPYFKGARSAGGGALWLTFAGACGSNRGGPTGTLSLSRADKAAVVVQWGPGTTTPRPPHVPALLVFAEVWNVWEYGAGFGRVAC